MQILQPVNSDPQATWSYAQGLGRASAGAVIFSLPILMTMEMWELGSYLDRIKLLQFALINFLLLVGLSRLSGFEKTLSWADDVLDAFSAYGVAAIVSLIVLALFGAVTPGMAPVEIVGKIMIETAPASFGAMLAGKMLGPGGGENLGHEKERRSYSGQLFLMMAGAVFLGFSVAPTEEIILISFRMTPWHSVALVIASIGMLHVLVYTVGFRGEEAPPGSNGVAGLFLRFSVAGYGIAAAVSLYLLWTFGRVDGASPPQVVSMVAVLAFPGAIGAAIARLVI